VDLCIELFYTFFGLVSMPWFK